MNAPDDRDEAEWQDFVEGHLGDDERQPEEPVEDPTWPTPHESAFLAAIDPWIVPVILVLLGLITLAALAAAASHQ